MVACGGGEEELRFFEDGAAIQQLRELVVVRQFVQPLR